MERFDNSDKEANDSSISLPHPSRNKLIVSTQKGRDIKAVSICTLPNLDFWATDEETRTEIERRFSDNELYWRHPPHLSTKVLVHIHPKSKAQTWLQNGDLLVFNTPCSGVFPLTREAALELGLTISVPPYRTKCIFSSLPSRTINE